MKKSTDLWIKDFCLIPIFFRSGRAGLAFLSSVFFGSAFSPAERAASQEGARADFDQGPERKTKLLKEAEYMAATASPSQTIAFRSGLGPYKRQV
ncbi:MAG: hypothetical protein WCA22_16595 [Candidatus Binatus sp.]